MKDKLREIPEADVDAVFAEMATDPDYKRDAIAMTREFDKSDWEAFQVGEKQPSK